MRQVRKNHGINGTAARLEAQMMTGTTAQWKLLSCPLSIEDHCGEYCAWYTEGTVGGAFGVPVQVVVSCHGHPIGALVTADTGVDHG